MFSWQEYNIFLMNAIYDKMNSFYGVSNVYHCWLAFSLFLSSQSVTCTCTKHDVNLLIFCSKHPSNLPATFPTFPQYKFWGELIIFKFLYSKWVLCSDHSKSSRNILTTKKVQREGVGEGQTSAPNLFLSTLKGSQHAPYDIFKTYFDHQEKFAGAKILF